MDGIEAVENYGAVTSAPRKADATQVLIVLSDNGVEQIPFVAIDSKTDEQAKPSSVSQLKQILL